MPSTNHIFETPFRVVFGTAGTPEETEQNKSEAGVIAGAYNKIYGANIEAVSEAWLDPAELSSRSLILVGNADSNEWLAGCAGKAKGRWPFLVTRKEIAVKGLPHQFSPRDFAFCAIYPSPWNTERYVLIISGVSDAAFFQFGCFAPCWLPDYVIASKPNLTVAEAGYFNESWRIEK